MRKEPLQTLVTMPLHTGVVREVDPTIDRRISFWTNVTEKRLTHATLSPKDDVKIEQALAFTGANIRAYDVIDQTFWERLRGNPPANTVRGPNDLNIREIPTAGSRKALVMWMKSAGVPIDRVIAQTWPEQSPSIAELGPQAAIVENLLPFRRGWTPLENYAKAAEEPRDAAAVRKLFDDGLDAIFHKMDKGLFRSGDSNEWGEALAALEKLRQFHRNDVGWAEERNDQMFSMIAGKRPKAWCVALSKNHPRSQTEGEPLSVSTYDNILRLLITPTAMDQRWAGLFLIHELTHMERMANGTYVKGGAKEYVAEEVLAFKNEYMAAVIATEGRMEHWLDTAIATHNLRDSSSLRTALPAYTFGEDMDALQQSGPPASMSEGALRAAFYSVALAFRMHERAAKNPAERAAMDHAFMSQAYAEHMDKHDIR